MIYPGTYCSKSCHVELSHFFVWGIMKFPREKIPNNMPQIFNCTKVISLLCYNRNWKNSFKSIVFSCSLWSLIVSTFQIYNIHEFKMNARGIPYKLVLCQRSSCILTVKSHKWKEYILQKDAGNVKTCSLSREWHVASKWNSKNTQKTVTFIMKRPR